MVASEGRHLVLINDPIGELNVPRIYINNDQSAYQATRHLLECGHTRIGHIGGRTTSYPSYQRFEGYSRAMTDAGLRRYVDRYTVMDNTNREEARAAAKKLQAAQEKTAAFIRRSEELCQAQSAFLQSLPELDFVPEQPESPAAEPQADVVSAIEQDILSKYIDAPEEKGAGSAVTDEPTIKLPPVDGSAIPSDFRLSLDELKFGRNYSGNK